MKLGWPGALRRKAGGSSGGLVTSVQIGTASTASEATTLGAEARRIHGGRGSALGDGGGAKATVIRIGESEHPKTSSIGRCRLG